MKAFLVWTSLVVIFGSRAPEIPPDLPEGWCDLKYGTPTRSTGECICKYECDGRGCQRSQGFIFYAYNSCPTCKCISKPIGTNTSTKKTIPDEISQQNELSNKQPKPQKLETNIKDKFYIEHKEEEFHLIYWLEDNGRFIFAAVVGLFVVIIAILMMIYGCISSCTPDTTSDENIDNNNNNNENRTKDIPNPQNRLWKVLYLLIGFLITADTIVWVRRRGWGTVIVVGGTQLIPGEIKQDPESVHDWLRVGAWFAAVSMRPGSSAEQFLLVLLLHAAMLSLHPSSEFREKFDVYLMQTTQIPIGRVYVKNWEFGIAVVLEWMLRAQFVTFCFTTRVSDIIGNEELGN
eukprot:gene9127-18907_t